MRKTEINQVIKDINFIFNEVDKIVIEKINNNLSSRESFIPVQEIHCVNTINTMKEIFTDISLMSGMWYCKPDYIFKFYKKISIIAEIKYLEPDYIRCTEKWDVDIKLRGIDKLFLLFDELSINQPKNNYIKKMSHQSYLEKLDEQWQNIAPQVFINIEKQIEQGKRCEYEDKDLISETKREIKNTQELIYRLLFIHGITEYSNNDRLWYFHLGKDVNTETVLNSFSIKEIAEVVENHIDNTNVIIGITRFLGSKQTARSKINEYTCLSNNIKKKVLLVMEETGYADKRIINALTPRSA